MRVAAALLAGALLSCAPRASAPQLVASALGEAGFGTLVAPFEAELRAAGVSVERGTVYRYEGRDPQAFFIITRDFYARHPGFCPVQGSFLASPDRPVYLTLAARGVEVRGFVYDRSAPPGLTFAYFTGRSETALGPAVCPEVRP